MSTDGEIHAAAVAFVETEFGVSFFADSAFISEVLAGAADLYGPGFMAEGSFEAFATELDARHRGLREDAAKTLGAARALALGRAGRAVVARMEENFARSMAGRLNDALRALDIILKWRQAESGGMEGCIALVEAAAEAVRDYAARGNDED